MTLIRCPKLKTCHTKSKKMPDSIMSSGSHVLEMISVTISPSLRHLELQGAARWHDAEAQTGQEGPGL